MTVSYINDIATAVPPHDFHQAYLAAANRLLAQPGDARLFARMAAHAGIEHRFSMLEAAPPGSPAIDAHGFYRFGAFPDTAARMQAFAPAAVELAAAAIAGLATPVRNVSHLILVSCTGFVAPGIDQMLAARFDLSPSLARTAIGFMGCAAAVNALRMADHIVRSEPDARVLVVNVELCSLHFQESDNIEALLRGLLFADGASACIVSAEAQGLALGDFRSVAIADSAALLGWQIGNQGFEMQLSGELPHRLALALTEDAARAPMASLLRGRTPTDYAHWAVHPGGRSVLDAVERAYALPSTALGPSRDVLRGYGNMSSATLMFILKGLLVPGTAAGPGLAMAFGPGLTAESFCFATSGSHGHG